MARYASGKPLAERKRSPRWGIPKPPKFSHKNLKEVSLIGQKKKPVRQRPFSISFRVSREEKEILEDKLSKSKLGKAEFLLRTLLDKQILCIDNGTEILSELKRQGNNLNQAVKSGYVVNKQDEIFSAVNECKKVYKKLSQLLGGG